jgi:hypothetical protein
MVRGMARFRGLVLLTVGLLACVAAPVPARNGGRLCRVDSECNDGPLCGLVRPCLDGFCAEDPVFQVCDAGLYPDGSAVVGQCITYLNCNAAACGSLIPCVNNRCDTTVPPLFIPCDAGSDGRVDTGRLDTGFDTGRGDSLVFVDTRPTPDTSPELSVDSSPDHPTDTTVDASADTSTDASTDATPADGATEAGTADAMASDAPRDGAEVPSDGG